MIKIPAVIYRRILELAQQQPDIEICGYLAGTDNQVREIFPLTNVDQSPEHFSFDPEEQFAVLEKATQQGLRLIAVFHSHPATPARMSVEDIKWANDPDLFYLIYSLLTGDLKAFRVSRKKEIHPAPLQVLS